jgi:hypothetical protein
MEEIAVSNDLTIKIYPPTRATKEDEVVSNPDLDGLLEFLLGFAQKMLPLRRPVPKSRIVDVRLPKPS